MNIVVTGSKGLIGKSLVKRLQFLKHNVIEIDLVLGHDVCSWQVFADLGQFDYLVHLAAKIFVPDSFSNPRSFYKTNVMGTLNALEACRKANANMIFFSSYAYGSPDYLPIDELHPVKSYSPYSRTKIMGEDLCLSYFADFGVKSVIFRPFNIFGPGQDDRFLISLIASQISENKVVLNDERPKRDYIYIDDIISAVTKALKYDAEGADVFNLGSGKSHSVKELVDMMLEIKGTPVDVKYLNKRRPYEVLDTVANIEKAKNILGWEPQTDIKKGLAKVLCY